jgi:hypothetical protein
MATKQDTHTTSGQSTPETNDEQIAARIKALAANPTTPDHVQKRISRLTEVLCVEGLSSTLEDTPVMIAEQYRQSAPHTTTNKAKKAKAELIALVERYTTDNDADLDAFAHHLSEVLRIARTHDLITTRFYNDLADSWNSFVNDVLHKSNVWDSQEYVLLILREAEKKGGAE